jgi:hypothetical protein
MNRIATAFLAAATAAALILIPSAATAEDKIIGMSSPASLWDTRVVQVGEQGLTARRIFAQLNSQGTDQMNLVAAAHNAQMTPVYSFKVPSVSTAINGGYDSWVRRMVDRLDSYGQPTTVTFHHEPHQDMTPAQFVAVNTRYLPLVQDSVNLSFGPILNGWLLDRRVNDFASYTSPGLRAGWDFIGMDTYEQGTMENPGTIKPGDRMDKLENWLASVGIGDKRVVIGEYNGYSAVSIADAGAEFLSSPNVWIACIWNATGGKGWVLDGARLAAFQATKADLRVRQ